MSQEQCDNFLVTFKGHPAKWGLAATVAAIDVRVMFQ